MQIRARGSPKHLTPKHLTQEHLTQEHLTQEHPTQASPMKAVFITKHGGLDVLQYGDLPTPEPATG